MALQDVLVAGSPNKEDYNIPQDETALARVDVEENAKSIVSRLNTLANDQVTAKSYIEERWLENLRAYHGFYDPDTESQLREANQSRAFIKITGAKTRALTARLYDLIFPTDDRNWGIEATPVPKLSKAAREAEAQAQEAADQANREQERQARAAAQAAPPPEQVDPNAAPAGPAMEGQPADPAAAMGQPQADVQQQLLPAPPQQEVPPPEDPVQGIVQGGNEAAERAMAARTLVDRMNKSADLMQDEMDDQLVESCYPQECRKLITDGGKLGTGILKGPVANYTTRGAWVFDAEAQQWGMQHDEETPAPKLRRVDPWSFFPDMSARSIDEAEFTFERYLWSKKQLRKMVKTHGFNADAVRRLIRETNDHGGGLGSSLNYIAQLRSIAKDEATPIRGRYVGWEYHGPLECSEVATLLRAMGADEIADEYEERNDPLDEMNVVAFFCDGELLSIHPEYPLDSGETLYSVFNVVEAEACIFGYGVPHLIDSTQAALNAAWRMGLDNSAFSVKPQIALDKDHIQPVDGDWNMAPGKIWLRTKGGTASDGKVPIEFFNVPNNMQEIMMIVRLCMEFADIESGIPMPQQGEQGAHTTNTVGGMAILQNASNIVFRAIVKNFDDGIITPTMRRLYDWNMQFNQRDELKGDMQVDARGTSVLLVKEVQAANLMVIITGLMQNPTFAAMMKPYEAITKLFQSMMIKPSDVLVAPEEYEQAMKAQAEAPPPEDPNVVMANARIEAAKIVAASREFSDKSRLEVEKVRQNTAMIQLATEEKISIEDLRTKLNMKQIEQDGKERMMAAEIGAERSMAAEARERGETPAGSGGYVSSGSEQRPMNATNGVRP